TACEPVDLATVAEDVLDSADRGDRRGHAPPEPPGTPRGPGLLERMGADLVGNPPRDQTPSGDPRLTTAPGDGEGRPVAGDPAPLTPQPALGVLFEPFQRLNGRTGSDGFGLGLAIVASITTAHHGTVTADHRPGGGLTVTVTMPRPDDRTR